MRELILEGVRRQGTFKVTRDFLDAAFPQPRRPTADDVWLNILEAVGGLCILDRGITNIFQPTQQEQIEEFCERHGLEMLDSYGADYGLVKLFRQKEAV